MATLTPSGGTGILSYDGNIAPANSIITHNGLAIYDIAGHMSDSLLLMPYPHAFTLIPIANGPLAGLLAGMNRRVVTFDPPGNFRSSRPPRVDMPEMLECAYETLDVCEIEEPVDLVGHSMGGLCALALALERPDLVRHLVLIGAVAGGRSVLRHRGMPLNWWPIDPDFWRFVVPALRLRRGKGSMADHKRVEQMMAKASFVDKTNAPKLLIRQNDERRPAPVRDRWPAVALRLDYRSRLAELQVPTLVCVGRFDPQAPVGCSKELARGIPGARLVVFEHSGHSPQVEEPELFRATLEQFFRAN